MIANKTPQASRASRLPFNLSGKLAALIVVVVLALGVGSYALVRHNSQPATPPPVDTSGGVNLDPPTKTDKKEAEDHKDQIVEQQKTPPPPVTNGKQTIAPVIVDANQYDSAIEVRAFEPSVTESNGQCTVTFVKAGSATVSKTVVATADATTTRCTNLQVPRSEFASAGSWDVTVTYSSAKTTGSTSGKVEVK